MSKPMIRIHNTETNEIIDREMNDTEFANYQARQLEKETEQAEAEAKATQKAALLERLGITEAEAKLLLG
jgi:hypothetical protein